MRNTSCSRRAPGGRIKCPAGLIALEVLRIPMWSWWAFGDLNPGPSD